MRYQSKPYRSVSYIQRESNNLKELRDIKDNKENTNCVNIPTSKLNKSKDLDSILLGKLKLEHKVSDTTTHSSIITPPDSLSDQLKKTYTQNICRDYSIDILTHLCSNAQTQKGFLDAHTITASLRSKMVDWMIEVLSSYKMTEQTFFRSVYLMDAYMKNCQNNLEVKDLHLIGVTTMFSAAKYEEIHPIKLNIIFDKIARKKFKKCQILDKQSDIITTLDFKLQGPSVYNMARHIVEEINVSLAETSRKYFSKILLYLSKMTLFSQELVEQHTPLLSSGVVFIGLKTLEQVDPSAQPEGRLTEISLLMGIEEETILQVSKKVLDLAKNFSKSYPSLTNLKKFNKFQYGVG